MNFILKLLHIVMLAIGLQYYGVAQKLQWQDLNSHHRAVQYVDSTTLMIVGNNGKILRSTDGGFKWKWSECGVREDLTSLHFLDTQRGFVAGSGGVILKTLNGGKSWIQLTPLPNGYDTSTITGIQALSMDTLVALAGFRGSIFRTTDGGSTWISVFQDSLLKLSGVKFGESIGAVTGSKATVLLSYDRGESWKTALSGADTNSYTGIDIRGSIILAGGGHYIDTLYRFTDTLKPPVLYSFPAFHYAYSSNGGITWKETTDRENGGRFYNTMILDSINAIGFGTIGTYTLLNMRKNAYISRKLDLSYLWKLAGNYFTPDLCCASFISPRVGVVVGWNSFIAFTNDAGATWDVRSWCYIWNSRVDEVTHVNDTIALAESESARIFYSGDGGTTWLHRFPKAFEDAGNNSRLNGFRSINYQGVGFVSGDNLTGVPLFARTSDFGYTWKLDKINSSSAPGGTPAFLPGGLQTIYTRYDNSPDVHRLHKTLDTGRTWEVLPTPPPGSSLPIFLSIDTAFLVGDVRTYGLDTTIYPNGTRVLNEVYRTMNGGISYDTVFRNNYSTDKDKAFFSRIRNNGNTLYLLGQNTLFRSEDKGTSWHRIPNPFGANFLSDMVFSNDTVGFAIVGAIDSLSITIDGGFTWKNVWLHSKKSGNDDIFYFSKLSVEQDSLLYLTGRNRFLRIIVPQEWRRNKKVISVEESKIAEGTFNPYFFIKTVPIPAVSSVKITLYGLYSVKNLPLKVKVFNMLGYEVADFSHEATNSNNGSTSTFSVDINQLGTGVYILQYSAGGYSKSGLLLVAR